MCTKFELENEGQETKHKGRCIELSKKENHIRSVFTLQDQFEYNSVQLGITPFNSVLKPNKTELYRVITWYNSVQLCFSLF